MSISVPVSVGEAVDKLSILEIKLQRIKHEQKLVEVRKEYQALYQVIKEYIVQFQYFYKLLVEINTEIWDDQDKIRDCSLETKKELCQKILDDNDKRFRLKDKINRLSDSNLKEQKGYKPKRAFVCGHPSIGDMINMIGAVRYLAISYDEVRVVCKPEYEKKIAPFLSDDPTIELYVCDSDQFVFQLDNAKKWVDPYTKNDYEVFACGMYLQKAKNNLNFDAMNIPVCFYEDLGLDFSIMRKYFYVNPQNTIEPPKSKYFFVHDVHSRGDFDLSNELKELYPNTLIINPDKNIYDATHPFFQEANLYLKQRVIDMIPLIQNAEQVYCVDSVMLCLANLIDTKKVKKMYYISRDGRIYDSTYIKPQIKRLENKALIRHEFNTENKPKNLPLWLRVHIPPFPLIDFEGLKIVDMHTQFMVKDVICSSEQIKSKFFDKYPKGKSDWYFGILENCDQVSKNNFYQFIYTGKLEKAFTNYICVYYCTDFSVWVK